MIEGGIIETAWRDFKAKAAHPETSPQQLVEMRCIFFAGWLDALNFSSTASEAQEASVKAELEDWVDEIVTLAVFGTGVMAGRA